MVHIFNFFNPSTNPSENTEVPTDEQNCSLSMQLLPQIARYHHQLPPVPFLAAAAVLLSGDCPSPSWDLLKMFWKMRCGRNFGKTGQCGSWTLVVPCLFSVLPYLSLKWGARRALRRLKPLLSWAFAIALKVLRPHMALMKSAERTNTTPPETSETRPQVAKSTCAKPELPTLFAMVPVHACPWWVQLGEILLISFGANFDVIWCLWVSGSSEEACNGWAVNRKASTQWTHQLISWSSWKKGGNHSPPSLFPRVTSMIADTLNDLASNFSLSANKKLVSLVSANPNYRSTKMHRMPWHGSASVAIDVELLQQSSTPWLLARLEPSGEKTWRHP